MNLRGIDLNGNPYVFGLEDCPVAINDKITALVNKPDSPLINTQTIMRQSKESGLAESDFVFNEKNNFIGYIVYTDRFCVWSVFENKIVEFQPTWYTLVNSGSKYMNEIDEKRSPILYRADDIVFDIRQLVRIQNDKIIIYRKLMKTIYLSSARICLGLKLRGRDICLNDGVEDGIIVIHENRPMVKLDDGSYRNLKGGEYDG